MRQSRDCAWILDPDWLVFLGGYRIFNYIGTTWHYLAGGREVEAIGALFKEMSRRRRAGRRDWFSADAQRHFELRDHQLYMRDDDYHCGPTSLFDDADLTLVFSSRSGTQEVDLPLDRDRLRVFGELLPRLRRARPSSDLRERPDLIELAELLGGLKLVVEVPVLPQPGLASGYVLRLTGHGGVLVTTPATRILIDPLLTLRYRPEINRLRELDAPLDAVVITQARWSHFDLDTLLHVERSTPIYLPRQEHPTSLDNIDMYSLLRELGFETLRPLAMWHTETIGEVAVTATPFRGAGLGPDSPADWMTLHVAVGGRTAFLATDACADQRGSMDQVIRDMARRLGPVDLLLASYEDYHYPVSWFTRRPFYLGPGREQASTSADDAIRWTTLADARHLVPYASFDWSREEQERDPPDHLLYAGVVQHGALTQLSSRLREWPAGPLIRLPPGGELRWQEGAPFTMHLPSTANHPIAGVPS